MLVVTDFPDRNGKSEQLCFVDPREVIVAETIADVRAALDRVAARAAAGCYAVGFVAYDAAPAFDSALRTLGRSETPLLWFGIYDTPQSVPASPHVAQISAMHWSADVTRAEYEDAIEGIRNGIRHGSYYQVSHTIRLRTEWRGDPRAAYEALRIAQPSSYGMYLDIGRFRVLSVSPELFFKTTGRDIVTRPMKGTTRRGRWSAEDLQCAATLAASSKDRAENVMIVDLVRNDLGRIAEVGSVAVPRLFDVERHPTLWQMTSTITARLREAIGLSDIFSALFPCGSVVGAPKVAAAAWIADRETSPRGVYCGAIGIVRPGGDCTFNVAIRTIIIDADSESGEYGTGGGITIDSTAVGEYDELLAKAAILGPSQPEFDLLETMRLSNGRYVRRDGHIRRLLASADYFDFPDVAPSVGVALDECARLNPTGDHRVRLLVSRAGAVRTEATPIAALHASPNAQMRCVVDMTPVSSQDRFLFHKTTHRKTYDERRAAHPDSDEVILVNECGELTECSVGNLVVALGDEPRALVTPPIDCGVLAGVFREELLAQGVIAERVLHPSDLAAATQIWRVNSLREWVKLDLIHPA